MNQVSIIPDDNSIFKLHKAEVKDPMIAINRFFEFAECDLGELKRKIWDQLFGYLSCCWSDDIGGEGRNYHLYLHELLNILIDATYILNERHKIRKKPGKKRL